MDKKIVKEKLVKGKIFSPSGAFLVVQLLTLTEKLRVIIGSVCDPESNTDVNEYVYPPTQIITITGDHVFVAYNPLKKLKFYVEEK